MQPSHQIKYPIGEDGVFNLVSHVVTKWNTLSSILIRMADDLVEIKVGASMHQEAQNGHG